MNDSLELMTEDGIRIFGRLITHREVHHSSVLIIAPGFASHSLTDSMIAISRSLSDSRDVICLDLRGQGMSDGHFSFGAHEHLDILAAIHWASARYGSVDLLGFSLGAYSSIRAAAEQDSVLKHVLLVSCPTLVNEIFWKGWAFRRIFQHLMSQNKKIKNRSFPKNWINPLSSKPSAVIFAPQIKVPVSFLVGGVDVLVPKSMTEKVYRSRKQLPSTFFEVPEGDHADEIFLTHPIEFCEWISKELE